MIFDRAWTGSLEILLLDPSMVCRVVPFTSGVTHVPNKIVCRSMAIFSLS
jgi:hypothetical protein